MVYVGNYTHTHIYIYTHRVGRIAAACLRESSVLLAVFFFQWLFGAAKRKRCLFFIHNFHSTKKLWLRIAAVLYCNMVTYSGNV